MLQYFILSLKNKSSLLVYFLVPNKILLWKKCNVYISKRNLDPNTAELELVEQHD